MIDFIHPPQTDCGCSTKEIPTSEIDIRFNRVSDNNTSKYKKIKGLIHFIGRQIKSQIELEDLIRTLPTEEIVDVFYYIKKVYLDTLSYNSNTNTDVLKNELAKIIRILILRFLNVNSLDVNLTDYVTTLAKQRDTYFSTFEVDKEKGV